jgi:hypothetical protein
MSKIRRDPHAYKEDTEILKAHQRGMERLKAIVVGVFHTFPDAVFFGSGFIALLTLSFSFAVFFLSLVEGTILFHAIHALNKNLQIIPTETLGGEASSCRSGLEGTSIQGLSVFDTGTGSAFPSSHIYTMSFIASYLVSVLLYFQEELEILSASYGEEFHTRTYISVLGFAFLLFGLMCYRLLYKCDGSLNIIMSLLIGLFIGAVVAKQNGMLFGKESINLLGVPILRRRDENGNDLYVCSPNS